MQKTIKLFGISNEKIKMHYIITDMLSNLLLSISMK